MRLQSLLLVGLGGFFGAIARALIARLIAARWGTHFPYGTLVINVTGCLLIGFFLTLATERLSLDEAWRALIAIGFVGAYTTFSTYEYETLALVESGAWGKALGYVLVSTLAGFVAVLVASGVARRL